jgi:hypothetical protein
MGKANFKAASIAAACGAVLLATLPLAPRTAAAADLPIKAPPKIPDSGNPACRRAHAATLAKILAPDHDSSLD